MSRKTISRLFSSFVPSHSAPSESELTSLRDFLSASQRLLVLTGAGVSTESGIPDYRSEGVGLYATSKKRPIQHKVFMDSDKTRQSYWARNFVAWPRWSALTPNRVHLTLSQWESKNRIHHIVTQNVDQLHYKAGCNKVIELHGTNSLVKCTSCRYTIQRHAFQAELKEVNAEFANHKAAELRPDGDVELSEEEVKRFKVPPCPKCSGLLKPDVVFFGDNVPKDRVEFVRRLVTECDSLLVVGSSLSVFSGYRFVLQAKEKEGKPLAIVNIGPTRADHLADVRVNGVASEALMGMKL